MSEEREASTDLFMALATLIGSRGKERLGLLAEQSKKKLALRSLRKDRIKMYEKLGREVEQLCAAGEIHHPGLLRGVERIRALENQIKEASKKFGSQCIVVAIDAKKNGDKWEVFTHGGRNNSGIDALEYAKKMEENGAGELLVTSMDRDGTQVGYDIDLMSKISSKVNIPVIASGGVGNLDHLVDGIKLGKASAVLAASIFHYGKYSVKEAKEYLDSKGIPVRI